MFGSDMKNSAYNCAIFFAAPYFVGTFILGVVAVVCFWLSTRYVSVQVNVVKAGVVFDPIPMMMPTTTTLVPMVPDKLLYRYEVSYVFDNRPYTTVHESYKKYNIGEIVKVEIHKSDPRKIASSATVSAFLVISGFLFCVGVVACLILLLMMTNEIGRASLCASGIIGVVKNMLGG